MQGVHDRAPDLTPKITESNTIAHCWKLIMKIRKQDFNICLKY